MRIGTMYTRSGSIREGSIFELLFVSARNYSLNSCWERAEGKCYNRSLPCWVVHGFLSLFVHLLAVPLDFQFSANFLVFSTVRGAGLLYGRHVLGCDYVYTLV
ncbi:hypothetical protein V8F20_001446 [Naviculisporaceae sp. PSN 640]